MSVDELLNDLENGTERDQEDAAFDLGHHREKRVVDALILTLTSSKEPGIRSAAAESLGRLADLEAFDALMKGLTSELGIIRNSSAFALGKLGDKRAADSIAALLADEDKSVVSSATHALAKLADHRAVYPLIKIVETGRYRQQLAAVRVLGELKAGEGVATLSQLYNETSDPDLRQAIIKSLGEIGSADCIPVLVNALDNQISYVRKNAVLALGVILHKPVEPKLRQMAKADEDPDVRAAAKTSLEAY